MALLMSLPKLMNVLLILLLLLILYSPMPNVFQGRLRQKIKKAQTMANPKQIGHTMKYL